MPSDASRRAAVELRQARRKAQLVVVGSSVGGALGLALAVGGVPPRASLLLAALGLTFAGLFGTAWLRSSAALRGIERGPHRWVRAVGWSRPPDGCNFGLFWSGSSLPDAVMRLPLARGVSTSDAWLCGEARPSLWSAAALVGPSGALLGAGRIVSSRSGERKWQRRNKPPSRWVMQPQGSWRRPSGE